MVRSTKLLYIAAALVFVVGIVLFMSRSTNRPATSPASQQRSDQGADFTLPDLDGHKVSLSSFRGKIVFLNIWATWCLPCRQEMPSMEVLYQELKKNPDFVMLAVSQDAGDRSVVRRYVEKHGYSFKVLLDPDNSVGDAYHVSGVPETFIINREGRIVAHHMGAFDWSRPDVKQALLEMLDHQDQSAGRDAGGV